MQFRLSRALPPFSSALRFRGERFSLRSPRGGGPSDKRNCFWSPRDSQPSHSAHSRGREQSELGHLLAEPLPSWAQSAGGALQTRTQLKHTHGNKSRTERISIRIIYTSTESRPYLLVVMRLWFGEFLEHFKVACFCKLSFFMTHCLVSIVNWCFYILWFNVY